MPRDLDIVIDKQVPVAGGMGGGSADAAAALTGAAHLIGGVDAEVLADLALEIGADVPFLLRGGTAIGRGRGEELSPVLTRGQFHWVMATSAGQLSTPEVYGRFDELTPRSRTRRGARRGPHGARRRGCRYAGRRRRQRPHRGGPVPAPRTRRGHRGRS